MYTAVKLTQDHTPQVLEFCQAAARAGYENNSSLALMKFDAQYDLAEPAQFWGILEGDKLICVSGCHALAPGQQRCLFRSATLPDYDRIVPGLNKHHMNSLPFSVLLPLQVVHGLETGTQFFYITTSNSDHDSSGKMKRTHRALQLLARQAVVDFVSDEIIYHRPQTRWRLNLHRYLEALRQFHGTRERLQLCLDSEYYRIIAQGFS